MNRAAQALGLLDVTVEEAPVASNGTNGHAVTPVVPDGSINVEKLCEWGKPQPIYTRNGARVVRKAALPEGSPFWAIWRAKKEEVKNLGVTIYKDGGRWTATLWPKGDGQAKTQAPQEPQGVPQAVAVRQEIAAKLLDYQVASVGKLVAALQTYGTALDASDTGTGKSYCAIAAAKQLNLKPIILCPKSVVPSWKRCASHFGMDIFVTNYEQIKLGKTQYCQVIKTPQLRKDGKQATDKKGKPLFDTEFKWTLAANEVLICDECHRLSGRATANGELLIAAKDAGAKTMLLSATVADNPLGLRAIGYALELFPKAKDFYKFCFRNGVTRGRFGMEFTGGQAAMKRIHAQIFGRGKGSRLRIADIPGFPETSIFPEVIDFENSSQIQDAYDDMKRELSRLDEVELKDKVKLKDRQVNILTVLLRARQRTELLKVPTLAQMATDAIAEGMSVVIFVNFQDSLDALAALLKTNCTISGAQQGPKGDAEREANIQRFQRGDFPRLSIINPCFSARAVKQALGRVHRVVDVKEVPQFSNDHSRVIICNINAGGVGVSLHHLSGRKSVQKIVFCADTVEEGAAEAVQRKSANISLLNDGDILGGLDILRDGNQLQLYE